MTYEVHNEKFNGYNIRILIDEDAQNPFEDWDCEPPLAVYALYNRGITEYSTGYGEVNTIPTLTREQIKANVPQLLEMTECKTVRELARYGQSGIYGTVTDLITDINDGISSHLEGMTDSDRLEALCDLYTMQGIPAVVKSVRGSSQGDYAEVLAVATLEFQEACGNASDYDWIEGLKGSIQLFEDWAFGNVYGYIVEDAEGNEVDSCWGFFGDYNAPYGAMHEAEAAINWRVACDKKKHIEQVKTWIKNRVPLHYRLAI